MLGVYLVICFTLLFGCADNQPVVGPYPTFGEASWYTARRTASGERFDRRAFTCAMRKFDFGKYFRVCNIANNKCVVVRHNDFGPGKRLYLSGRIIDLSQEAFCSISDLKQGIIKVTLNEEIIPSREF